jgi:hypothetical protein
MMADTSLSPTSAIDADRHDHHHRHSGDVREGGDDAALLLQSAAEGMQVGDATVTDDPIALIEAAIERLRDDVGAIVEPAVVAAFSILRATDLPNYLRLRHKAKEANKGCLVTSGQLLAWIPILSQENFPDVPLQILHFADRYQEAMRWPIHRPEELLDLPEGITGWLLPADAEDTDVACGVWNGEVYILGVKDKRTGRAQTLLGERVEVATGQADDPEQSAV